MIVSKIYLLFCKDSSYVRDLIVGMNKFGSQQVCGKLAPCANGLSKKLQGRSQGDAGPGRAPSVRLCRCVFATLSKGNRINN